MWIKLKSLMNFELFHQTNVQIPILNQSTHSIKSIFNKKYIILFSSNSPILYIFDVQKSTFNKFEEFASYDIEEFAISHFLISPSGDFFIVCLKNEIYFINASNNHFQKIQFNEDCIEQIEFLDNTHFIIIDQNNSLIKYSFLKGNIFIKQKIYNFEIKPKKIIPISTHNESSLNCFFLFTDSILLASLEKEFLYISNMKLDNQNEIYITAYKSHLNKIFIAYFDTNNIIVKYINDQKKFENFCNITIDGKNLMNISFLSQSLILMLYKDSAKIYSTIDKEEKSNIILFNESNSDNGNIISFMNNTLFKVYPNNKAAFYYISSLHDIFSNIENQTNSVNDLLDSFKFISQIYMNVIDFPEKYSKFDLQQLISGIYKQIFQVINFDIEASIFEKIFNAFVNFNMNEWIIENGTTIFSHNLETFFNSIVEFDSNANKFKYTPEFINSLITTCKNNNKIEKFLISLPHENNYLKPLLKYAQNANSPSFAGDAYLYFAKIYSEALSFYEIAEQNDKILYILENYMSPSIAKWIFSYSVSENKLYFNRLSFIIKSGSIPLFQKIIQTCRFFLIHPHLSTSQCITCEMLINAILYTFIQEEINSKHKIYKIVESFIIDHQISKFSRTSLKFILSQIFSYDFVQPDCREVLLLMMLKNNSFPNELYGFLLKQSEKFHFKNAEKYILNLQEYSSDIIQYYIDCHSKKTIELISFLYTEKTKNSIEKIVTDNIDSLLKIDEHEKLLYIFPGSFQKSLITSIKTEEIKFYFIHLLILHNYYNIIDYSNFLISIPFLNKYFRNDIKKFLEFVDVSQYINSSTELMDQLEKLSLFAICCYLCVKYKIKNKSLFYLQQLILNEWKNDILIKDLCNFIFNTDHPQEKFEGIAEAFAYIIELERDDFDYLSELYHNICKIALVNNLDFYKILDVTQNCFANIGPERYHQICQSLCCDVQISKENSQKLKEIISKSKEPRAGTQSKCASCNLPLFIDDIGFISLKCGHVVHDTIYCYQDMQVCPKCHSK